MSGVIPPKRHEIEIADRYRREMGDLESLADRIAADPARMILAPAFSIDEAVARVVRDELQKFNVRTKRVLSLEETATYLGVSEGTVRNFVAQGKLTPVRFTRHLLFDIDDLDRLIQLSKAT
jgi:excisionase family DNA binding protein